jgi:GNAT superfamily N-acetyltransferase
VVNDIPALLDMGMRFHEGSGYSRLIQPSKQKVAETLRFLIESDSGMVFVDDREGIIVGAILGMLVTHFVSGEITAAELSWWVDEDYRGFSGPRLLQRLEDEAKAKGAKSISAVEPPGNPVVGALYQRRGYELTEKSYMKAL